MYHRSETAEDDRERTRTSSHRGDHELQSTVRKLVQEEQDEKLWSAIRIGKDEGMQLFNDSLYDFVTREFISREAAFEISPNVEELKMRLKGIQVKGPSIL